jgi:hypothetical protein
MKASLLSSDSEGDLFCAATLAQLLFPSSSLLVLRDTIVWMGLGAVLRS